MRNITKKSLVDIVHIEMYNHFRKFCDDGCCATAIKNNEGTMSFTIILAGIPGSGKSTILEETIKHFPQLEVINFGDVMLQEAALHHIDKDSLRKLPLLQQQKFGIAAAQKIAMNMSEIVCIDTHAMIKTPFGYCPGIPEAVIKILNPNMIGMVECSANLIHQRRQIDKTRKRDDETIEQIEYHQQISRSFLLMCTALSNALFVPVQNDLSATENAQFLIAAIKSQF